ncbi:MAG: serine/threonine-protein kinase [Polyangiaceae bacterium]|nr:serine/threonine-protein kinase [Polyangiaceae bacterium]
MAAILAPKPRAERYVLLERLGSGGAGEAWRARREGGLIEEEVCVKRPHDAFGPAGRAAFLEEARVLSRVRHGNVVALIDVVEDQAGSLLLIMELVRGANLRAVMSSAAERGEPLSPEAVAEVGAGVCRALSAAARAVPGGVVHRDVSPRNLLVSLEGEVKLADFGVARAYDRARWTRSGLVKGKTAYLSPEQARGEPLDARSDLFALGVVLYELLAGERPFEPRGAGALLDALTERAYRPLVERAPRAPRGLAEVVEQLLAASREARPPSAEAALRLLGRHTDARGAAELRRAARGAASPGLARARSREPSLTAAATRRR